MAAPMLTCVREKSGVSELLPPGEELRQSCVMYPLLFNVSMDSVGMHVKASILSRGLEQFGTNGGSRQ